MVASIDTAAMVSGFRPATLGLEHLAALVELPVDDLIRTLEQDRDLCDQVLGQSYDKRYSPSTFIKEDGNAFLVGWYKGGYMSVRTFSRLDLAVADYLLFSFGKGRLKVS